MPNNNPQGHNQYTKEENRSNRASKRSAPERSASADGRSKRDFVSMNETPQREAERGGGDTHGPNR